MSAHLQDVAILRAASQEVLGSSLLLGILEIVLAIGNYLNTGSASHGSAVAFTTESLLKLRSVRSVRNRSVTVLHILAR